MCNSMQSCVHITSMSLLSFNCILLVRGTIEHMSYVTTWLGHITRHSEFVTASVPPGSLLPLESNAQKAVHVHSFPVGGGSLGTRTRLVSSGCHVISHLGLQVLPADGAALSGVGIETAQAVELGFTQTGQTQAAEALGGGGRGGRCLLANSYI